MKMLPLLVQKSGIEKATTIVVWILVILVVVTVIVIIWLLLQNKSGSSRKSASEHDVPTLSGKSVEELVPIDGIFNGMLVQNNGTRFTAGIICYGFDYFSSDPDIKKNCINGYRRMICSIGEPISLNSTYHSFDISRQAVKHEDALKRLQKEKEAAEENLELLYERMAEMDEDEIVQMIPAQNQLKNTVAALTNQCAHMESIIEYLNNFTEGKEQIFQDYCYFVSHTCNNDELAEDFDTRVDFARADLDNQLWNLRSRLQGIGVSCRVLSEDDLKVIIYRHSHPSGRNMTDEDIIRAISEHKTTGYAGKGVSENG